MRQLFIFLLLSCSSLSVLAQATGDYRSAGTGTWNTLNTWERFNGSVWVTPTVGQGTPTSTSGAIEIRTTHGITVSANVTVDQVTINGTLTINSGITVSAGTTNTNMITVGTGTLTVDGTITLTTSNAATISGTTTANTFFNAGSLYIHDNNTNSGGVVPTATWNITSTLRIGFSDNRSYTLTSTSWSQPFGNVDVNITSTGNRTNNFAGLLTTINGNFSVTNNASNANSSLSLASSGTNTLTIGGNFSMTANTTFNIASAGGATSTVRVGGNFSITTGTLTSTGTGTLNFNGPGNIQTYARVGTISALNYSINAGSIVDVGTSTMPGTGSFTLSGELRTGSATGLNGTLTTSGTKTFNANATITYNGSVAQVMGTLYPASPASGINVTINNTLGVTTSIATTIVPGNLFLQSGNLIVAASQTLQLDGTVSRTSGNISMNASANLTINGNGALGVSPFPFAADQSFNNFIINRSSGTITLGNNVTVNGTMSFSNGTLAIESNQVTLNGAVSVSSGLLSGTSSSTLSVAGAGALNTINFASGGNILGTLNLNRSGASLSFGGDFTLTNSLNVTTGTLNGGATTITMQGSTWSVDESQNGFFNGGTGTVIFDGTTTVTSGSSTGSFHHIQLNSARTLDFPTASVNVSGNIDFNSGGTFNHNGGTIFLNGGSTQTFNGGAHQYNNITVNKTGDVTLTGGVNLNAVLDVQSVSDFQSNGNLTLVSTGDDPDATGSIAALLNGADVSGTVNSQRLISAEGRLYRYVSTPISGVTVADWQNDFVITGTFTGASTNDPANGNATSICGVAIKPSSPSLYYYNEPTAGTIQNGWIDYPANGTGEPIEVGRGYSPFIRETCYRDVVITVSGDINSGSLSLPTSFTNTGSGDDGWNLIGNPYPSAIRWDADGNGWTKGADLSTSVDVRDNVSGGFVTLVEGDAIAQGQAFWVKTNGADFGLSIDETAKVSPGTGSSFYRVAQQQRDLMKINLTKGAIIDYAYYRMVEGASDDFERNDFLNQDNDLFDVATLVGTKQVAVNSVGTLSCGRTIPVHVKDMTNGTYTFTIGREGIFTGMDVILKDKFTGVTTNLSQNENYQFEVTADAATKASDRFEIELTLLRVAQAENATICKQGNATFTASGNYENGSYNWYESIEATTPLSSGMSFVTPDLSSTKTYYVSAVSVLGCEGERTPILAEVMQYDNAVITVTEKNVLSSNSATGNQWYFNNEIVEGATGQTFSVTQSGMYTVDISYSGCVTTISKEYRMLHVKEKELVTVFPNPIMQGEELQVEIVANRVGAVQIVNSVGRVVAELKMTMAAPGVWTATTKMDNLPTGFYYVRTLADNIPSTIKVVKTQ
jgi:hypothetical protein